MRLLAEDTDVWSDDTWLIDSTPIECSRSVRHDETLPARWMGRLRLLRLALPVLLGGCDCTSCAHRPGCRSPSPWPTRRSTNATSPSTCSTTTRSLLAGRAGQTLIAGQGLRLAAPIRAAAFRAWGRTHPTGTQRRAAVARHPPAEVAATDHRIGQRHLERPAQPGTTRRPQPTRRHRAHPPTPSRPHRRHLAQPSQRAEPVPAIAHAPTTTEPLDFSSRSWCSSS